MKRTLAIVLLFTLLSGTYLSAEEGVREAVGRKKVGLVLSGGGAKGVAHIGVIKVLEEAGIPIDYIAGTSMGAIVGGLYSIGYTSHELDSLVRNQDWLVLLSDRIARNEKLLSEKEVSDTYLLSVALDFKKKFTIPSGVLAGQSVLNLLNEMTIGYHDESLDFNSMPIPFACVAYDMVTGSPVVFRSGNLPTAIRASMSIPGAFAPVQKDGMVLVDGGIYNNFPADIVKEMGAEIIIGVDLADGTLNTDDVNSILGLVDQITTFIGREKYNENIKLPDLYMHPDIKPYSSSSFSAEAIDSLLIRGERVARNKWDEIIALKAKICPAGHYELSRPEKNVMELDSIKIGSIHFTGLTKNEEGLIRKSLQLDENCSTTKDKLNNAITRLRGSGAFSYVTYTLDSREPHNLHISVNEKQEAAVNIGFRFDSEQMASILLNMKFHFRGLLGPMLGITARLNENPYVKLDFNSSGWLFGRIGLSYMYKQNSYQVYSNGKRANNVSFGQNRIDLCLLDAIPSKFSFNLGIRYEHFNYDSFLYASEKDFLAVKPEGFLNYYINGHLETLNNKYYPTAGVSLSIEAALHTDNGYGHEGGPPFGDVSYHFRSAVSVTDRIAFIPVVFGRTLIGNKVAYAYLNYMGGEEAGRYMDQQIPFVGISSVENVRRSLMGASLELRQRLFMRHYISLKGAYSINNNDFIDMFTERNDIWGAGIKYSYDSPIGPISLQISHSNLSKGVSVYFSLGKSF